jgi:small subunit ribosomal protein S17
MIEETENPTPEEETPVAEAPEAPEEAAAEAPAEEPAAAAAAPAEPAEPAAPVERLHPKEQRKKARREAGEQKPPRTLEERLAEREAERQRLAAHRRARRTRERERRRGAGTGEATQPTEKEPGRKRIRQGIVVSDKGDKTITVRIEIARPHRVYKKIVRTSATLRAHDERNEAHLGDTVRVIESRPLSRTKRWRLVEILERAR